MTNEEIKDIVDNIEIYVRDANVDEITGRMFRLGIEIDRDKNMQSALILSLIVVFSEEKKDD